MHYLFDRMLSYTEDNNALANSFIYNMNEKNRMIQTHHIIKSLADLDHEEVYQTLPKPKSDTQADSFGPLLRILIKASSENYTHKLVDELLERQEYIAPNNKLLWIFIALASKPKHIKRLEEVLQRTDLQGNEEMEVPRHNRTVLFLSQAVDRFRQKNNRCNKYTLEVEVTGLHGVPYDGVYHYES